MTGQGVALSPRSTDRGPRPAWLLQLVVAVLCATAFTALVDGVHERGDLSSLDPTVTESFVAVRSTALTQVAHVVTLLGSVPVLVVLAVVVSSLLSRRRHSLEPLATMGAALGGSAVLTYALKAFVGRQRPPVADMLGAVDRDFSFPSGHTLNSAVFLAVLCWLLREDLDRVGRVGRVAVPVVAGLAALAVGASRIYLGYHWMTDVLAGWVVAVGWLSLLLAARPLVRARRAA